MCTHSIFVRSSQRPYAVLRLNEGKAVELFPHYRNDISLGLKCVFYKRGILFILCNISSSGFETIILLTPLPKGV